MGKKAKRLERKVEKLQAKMSTLMKAGYDSAKWTDENRKHWAQAEDKPPALMNDRETRRRLRVRCHYEAGNNSYCAGLISTLATDTIGYTGPKLRVLSDDSDLKTLVEEEWTKWSESFEVNLPFKLDLMERTKYIEGESFPYLYTDEEVGENTGISLGVNVLSQSRIADPDYINTYGRTKENIFNDDGVLINRETGRPIGFNVVPDDADLYGYSLIGSKPDFVSSRYMFQWFSPKRPSQYRGVCELTPSLGLYAQLRRYGLATLTAAEFGAVFAGVMKTTNPAADGPVQVKDWTQFYLERGMLLSLPEGWDATQFDAKHPMQSQEMFTNLILREIGRCQNVPFGIVAGDSSKYNYSSAQLDYRDYEERKKSDKKQLSIRILNRIFREFLLELGKMYSKVQTAVENNKLWHTWGFPRRPSSDPSKDADAEVKRLEKGLITLSEIYADRGLDWQEELEQREKENKKLKELGLTTAQTTDIINTNNGDNTSIGQSNGNPSDATQGSATV